MTSGTLVALIMAGVAIFGAIGSTLLLSFRIGGLVGTYNSFMVSTERERASIRTDLVKTSDRLSLHIEHHGTI